MKLFKIYIIGFILLFFNLSSQAQTLKQFNGQLNIKSVTAPGGMNYLIKGDFIDLSGSFDAGGVSVGDRIIDANGNTFEIMSLTVDGSEISTTSKAFDALAPQLGLGIIYSPTDSGFPLITTNTPQGAFIAALNTATLAIDAKLPKYSSGTSVPVSSSVVGDVILNTSDSKVYKLTGSGWVVITAIPDDYSSPVSSAPPGTVGDVIKSFWDGQYYFFDGVTWISPATLSSLPTTYKLGDIFYATGEKALYMMNADSQWSNISGATTAGGTVADMPTGGKPGDLFFNTDLNILYVLDANGNWVEVSTNGSTPSGTVNPDPFVISIKEGALFYNTSDHKLYVYNGTIWIPVDNTLPSGRIFVGNSSNVAVPVLLSGDATMASNGNLTIKNSAVTEAKLDKANITLDGFANPANNVSLGDGIINHKIINLANPSTGTDATNKSYVDGLFVSPTLLALPNNSLFVGNASNKAAAVSKNLVTISGFASAVANISLGNGITNYKIINLLDPTLAQDAATKSYVDTKAFTPSNISLPTGNLLIGNAINNASAVAKNIVPLSGFGAAIANISIGGFNVNNLAEPTVSTDAATKNYVDNKIVPASSIPLPSGNLFVGSATNTAFAVAKNTIPLSGFGAAATDISFGGFKLNSLADPAAAQDAATKKYVDDLFITPASLLSLPKGNLFVGNAMGKAAATPKNLIPISGFGTATDDISMGDIGTQFRISFLAEPVFDQDAVTKYYVDTRTATPAYLDLATGYVLVGDLSNKATSVPKSAIPLSDLGAAIADISIGGFKINNLADPGLATDAATKNYVDTRVITPTDISLTAGNLFVGDITGKASDVSKSTIALSGFAAAIADIDLGTRKIVNLADPTTAQEAATKYYVDTRTATPANMDLTQDYVLVGNSSNKAASVPKSAILLSDLGAATANIDLGTKKIVNLA
ncbi:hypothetical protein ACNQGH_21590, partial [Flavobacterium sp. ZS1P14]